jgi:putative FmdB family regulatory protein
MPFYEYQCRACGAEIEVLQKINDKPLRKCAKCGKSALVKLVSAPVFRLKGGGWYETDFKSEQDKKRNLAGSEGDDKPKDEAKADAKADAKSESKAAADSAPAAKADGKADARSEGKSEGKSDSKADVRPRSKPAAKGARTSPAGRSAKPVPRARPAKPRKAK